MSDNVYDVPDKVDQEDWTAPNHNKMKDVLNKKFDKNDVLTDPSATPSPSKVWASSVVSEMIGDPTTDFRYLRKIVVTENLRVIIRPGYYIIENEEIPLSNTSYPPDILQYRWGGTLMVFTKENYVNQFLILNGSNTGTGSHSRIFTNYSIDEGDNWDGWEEFVNKDWLLANLPQLLPAGTPTISGGGVELSVTPHNCTDTKGQITLLNTSGSVLPAGSNITITYQIARPYASIVLLSTYMETTLKVTSYSPPTSTSCIIRLHEDLPIGGNTSFYYHIE